MLQKAEFFSGDLYEGQIPKNRYRKTDTAFCPDVIKRYRSIKADLLIVGGYSTSTGIYLIQYLRRYRIPFVLNCDGGLIKKDSWIKYRIKRFFISSASLSLSTGEACDQYLLYYGAKREGITVYPFTSTKEGDILIEAMKHDKETWIYIREFCRKLLLKVARKIQYFLHKPYKIKGFMASVFIIFVV